MTSSVFSEGAVLVFGGSGGIGQWVARSFAEAGSDVAIAFRSKESVAREVADSVRGSDRRASIHQVDVTDTRRLRETIAEVIAEHGQIHTVVWAAGPVAEQFHIRDTPEELWKRAFEVETHGFFNAVQSTLPHLRERGGGSYVHLGSAGHVSWPPMDVLSVAPKASNESLVQGIAKEEGRHRIRANSVLVGVIEAGMFLELINRGVFDERWVAQTQDLLAIKRWGSPREIGHAAVFLAENEYVTGQRVSVSGGFGL